MQPDEPARTAKLDTVFRRACARIARRHDPERYLACLFAPVAQRDALFALLAFNHEVAKTAEVVSEPTIGRIRLQWWRDTLEGIAAGRPRVHEVALPLGDAVAQSAVSLDRLHRLIDARESDLDGEPADTLDDLDAYAAETAGELHAAMAQVLGCDLAAAEEVGAAWGLIGLMRALPTLVISNRTPIPRSLLERSNLSHQKIKDLGGRVDLADAVRPVIEHGLARIDRTRESPEFRDPAFRTMRLLADRAVDLASTLRETGYQPFDPRVAALPTGLVWRYAGRMLRYRLGI